MHTIAALLTGVGVSGGYAVGVVALVPLPEPLPDEAASTDPMPATSPVSATRWRPWPPSSTRPPPRSAVTPPRWSAPRAGWPGSRRTARVASNSAGTPPGGVLAATGSAGTQQWAYTGNLVVSHTGTATGAEVGTTVERDEDGRVAAVVRDGVRIEYTHDAAGQPRRHAAARDVVHTWSWDAAGRMVAETAAGWTTHLHVRAVGAAGDARDGRGGHPCTYDRAGRRTSEVGPDGRSEFTRGDLGWLTSVTGPRAACSSRPGVRDDHGRPRKVCPVPPSRCSAWPARWSSAGTPGTRWRG